MIILTAPVQGHTDAPWRHFHHEIYNPDTTYFTPFIRKERDGVRQRDIKDMTSPLNEGLKLVPQVIFKNREELTFLLHTMRENGAQRVDLNIGCPFPLQTSAGRGAAMVGNKEVLSALPEILGNYPEIRFSAKLRLGFDNPEEWKVALPILNAISLDYVTLHPRVAKVQYGGEPNLEMFAEFLQSSVNPVIYNGDLKTPADMKNVIDRFPTAAGLMTGRGLLARPSLINEFVERKEWSREKRIEWMMTFHDRLFEYYSDTLCGDTQILSKIKPFWEYAESEIGRKPWKQIKKATSLPKYQTALALISNQ